MTLKQLRAKATQGEWHAFAGDVLNRDRTWGIVRYLTIQQNREVDGDDAKPNTRTEVIAEVCCAECGGDRADAILIAHSVNVLPDTVAALDMALTAVEYYHQHEGADVMLKTVRSAIRNANNIKTKGQQ